MKPRALVEPPRFLDNTALQKVLVALGAWIKRREAKP